VLAEQIARAKARIVTLPEVTMQMRLNFEMSVRMIKRSLADRDRSRRFRTLERTSGLSRRRIVDCHRLLPDLLTVDEVVEKGLILFVSLNTNKNKRACEALGKYCSRTFSSWLASVSAAPLRPRRE